MTHDDERGRPVKKPSEIIAEVMGRPAPRELTEEEKREFWAEQDRVDRELARRYGPADAA